MYLNKYTENLPISLGWLVSGFHPRIMDLVSFTIGNQSAEALMKDALISQYCRKRLPALISQEASGTPLEKKGGFYNMAAAQFSQSAAATAVKGQGLRLGTAAEALAYKRAGHPCPSYWVAMGTTDPQNRFLCWVNNTVGFKLCNYWIWVRQCSLFVVAD